MADPHRRSPFGCWPRSARTLRHRTPAKLYDLARRQEPRCRPLLGLPSSWRGGIATVTLHLATKNVAALLDTTPEGLSRSLRSLSNKGLIEIGAGLDFDHATGSAAAGGPRALRPVRRRPSASRLRPARGTAYMPCASRRLGAAAMTARARGCSLRDSSAAAMSRTCSRVWPAAVATSTTAGRLRVRVPVLSNATARRDLRARPGQSARRAARARAPGAVHGR